MAHSDLTLALNEEFSNFQESIRCVLFDYDRTIAEVPIDWQASRKPFHDYLCQCFTGISLRSGLRIDEMEEETLNIYPQHADTIFDFRRRLESNVNGSHIPDLDVVALITSLGQQPNPKRLFVVSNNLHITVEEGLKAIGIFDCFEEILAVDDVGRPKPSPRAAKILQDVYKIELGQSMLIGDSPSTDGEFCRRTGIPFFNVKTLTLHI